jgi:monoamine oxidase
MPPVARQWSFDMNRRDVLRLLSAAFAAAAVPACGGASETASTAASGPQCDVPDEGAVGKRVAIVGAGMAGLTAAWALSRCGFAVTVFEAGAEIGGRVRTSSAFPQPVDLGASWIHGADGNPLTPLLQTGHIVTDLERVVVFENGRQLTEAEVESLYAEAEAVQGEFDAIDEESETDMSVAAAIDLADSERSEGVEWALNSEIRVEYGADLTDLSFWWGTDDETFDGDDWLIVGGTRALLRGFEGNYEVRLSSGVTAITQNDAGASVTTADGTETFGAVICTVSCGILQAGVIEFQPAFSDRQALALQRIRMGTLDKTFLQFERQFWPDATVLGFVGAQREGIAEFFDLSAQAGAPVLMGFSAGSIARELASLSQDERVARAMATLRTAFPDAPEPVAVATSNWSQDETTLGSYSYLSVGGVPEDFLALEVPVGERVFLAGEHTNRDYRGTLHGAHFSGLRAASQVVDLLLGEGA